MSAIVPIDAKAIGIDLLGDVTKPLFGDAKDKTTGMLKFIWAQPYFGYGFGSGNLAQVSTAGTLVSTNDININGLMFGARGGLELGGFRLGLDYTRQFGKRTFDYGDSAAIVSNPAVSAVNSMLGFSLGCDIPQTPLQAFGAHYFTADIQSQMPTTGKGWGAGISFMLINPFILIAEYRWLNTKSDLSPQGEQTQIKMRQYYVGLSFLLF